MYLEHFGMREMPFAITPDTSYFYSYGAYQEALNVLLVALRSGEGFIKISGEVGTGKTLLCRKLLNTLGSEEHTSELQSRGLISYAVFCLNKNKLPLSISTISFVFASFTALTTT